MAKNLGLDWLLVNVCVVRLCKSLLPRWRSKRQPLPEPTTPLLSQGARLAQAQGFVSALGNSRGLKVDVCHDRHGGVSCRWQVGEGLEGFPELLHGGVSFSILDELLASAIVADQSVFALTLRTRAQYYRPIKTGTVILARARVRSRLWRLVSATADMVDEQGRLLMRLDGCFYIPTPRQFADLANVEAIAPQWRSFCGRD